MTLTGTSPRRHDDCIEYTNDKAKWMQWVSTEVDASEKNGGKETKDVFRERPGTRRELLDRIFELAPKYLFHMWVHQMTRHQEKLRVATFDSDSIIVKADFAATVELKAEKMATCEFGTHTNLYVALVLHSPKTDEEVEAGHERTVVCDIVRVFTNAKASAMVHQQVLQFIAKTFKGENPKLKWMRIITDGCASQFKGVQVCFLGLTLLQPSLHAGRFNFSCVAGMQFDLDGDYAGVKQCHSFNAPGHGGGPVDNAGKVAKNYLASLSAFKKQTAYNYATAYARCSEGMQRPSHTDKLKGTWGCNGEQFFSALSNGEDKGRDKFDNVPRYKGDVTAVAGCRTLFGFRRVSAVLPCFLLLSVINVHIV
jgi:hypothetical protein